MAGKSAAVEELIASVRAGFTRSAARTGLSQPPVEVLEAMARVPRDRFVPGKLKARAFADCALDIGYGATISQPFIVALMTTLARIAPGAKVLEVGGGSGYQAAVLAEMGAEVTSIELVPELVQRSRRVLSDLGYGHVAVSQADGWFGRADEAPFDAILVAAWARERPKRLAEQLAVGGTMVIPIGDDRRNQQLVEVRRSETGLRQRDVLPVVFVPMLGEGQPDD